MHERGEDDMVFQVPEALRDNRLYGVYEDDDGVFFVEAPHYDIETKRIYVPEDIRYIPEFDDEDEEE